MHNEQIKSNVAESINDRHKKAGDEMQAVLGKLFNNENENIVSGNEEKFDNMEERLKTLFNN